MNNDSFNSESPISLLVGDTMLKSGYGVELAGVLNNLGLDQNCSSTCWFIYFIIISISSLVLLFVLDVRALYGAFNTKCIILSNITPIFWTSSR